MDIDPAQISPADSLIRAFEEINKPENQGRKFIVIKNNRVETTEIEHLESNWEAINNFIQGILHNDPSFSRTNPQSDLAAIEKLRKLHFYLSKLLNASNTQTKTNFTFFSITKSSKRLTGDSDLINTHQEILNRINIMESPIKGITTSNGIRMEGSFASDSNGNEILIHGTLTLPNGASYLVTKIPNSNRWHCTAHFPNGKIVKGFLTNLNPPRLEGRSQFKREVELGSFNLNGELHGLGLTTVHDTSGQPITSSIGTFINGELYAGSKRTYSNGITEEGHFIHDCLRSGKKMFADGRQEQVGIFDEHGNRVLNNPSTLTFRADASRLLQLPQPPLTTVQDDLWLGMGANLLGNADPQIKNRYSRILLAPYSKARADFARDLVNRSTQNNASELNLLGFRTDVERQGLLNIFKYRNNIYVYQQLLSQSFLDYAFNREKQQKQLKEIVDKIKGQIDSLERDPPPDDVVQFNDGSIGFPLPGGTKNHSVTYEIRKKGNEYFFVMHGRNPRMIKVTKADLQNELFLNRLLQNTTEDNPENLQRTFNMLRGTEIPFAVQSPEEMLAPPSTQMQIKCLYIDHVIAQIQSTMPTRGTKKTDAEKIIALLNAEKIRLTELINNEVSNSITRAHTLGRQLRDAGIT